MRNTYGQHTPNWTSFSRLPYEIHHPRILLLTGKPACITLKQTGAQIPTTNPIRTLLDTSVTSFRIELCMSLMLKNNVSSRPATKLIDYPGAGETTGDVNGFQQKLRNQC